MKILFLVIAFVPLFAHLAASVLAMATTGMLIERYYTGGDTDAPYFIGYTYDGDWTALDCYPGATLSVSGNYGGCLAQGSTGGEIAQSCVSSSIQAVTPGVSYTCPEACATALLFPNLDGLNPTTFIPCATALYTAHLYRATTYPSTASVAPAATSATSSSPQSSSANYHYIFKFG